MNRKETPFEITTWCIHKDCKSLFLVYVKDLLDSGRALERRAREVGFVWYGKYGECERHAKARKEEPSYSSSLPLEEVCWGAKNNRECFGCRGCQ